MYPLARFAAMSTRAVHETIWAILFVTILGFGMMAGVLALTMFCIGFAGKLFAEEFEVQWIITVGGHRRIYQDSLTRLPRELLDEMEVA